MDQGISKSGDPRGELVIRTLAMPADANANGAMFGGWLFSQMDLGGAVLARNLARSRVVTAAVDAMSFVTPVNVSDTVSCYARLERTGRTSLRIAIDVWVQRYADGAEYHVTRGIFTYVAIDERGKPHPVDRRTVV